MEKLPDGSGFFVATVGNTRDLGLWNFLCCQKNGSTRRWYHGYLNYRDCRTYHPELGWFHAVRYGWLTA